MKKYFCGWYFRCQSDIQTLAIIPSIHKASDNMFCSIQIITDSHSFPAVFPYSDFHCDGRNYFIGKNQFSNDGITLNIQTASLQAVGALRFGVCTPIKYDIMGPFRYIPFLQCRHKIFSMKHAVDGDLTINGISFRFANAVGYWEGDRGSSFPRKYAWTQCFFQKGALMLSVADVPLSGVRITGIIGIIFLDGKEYRLATYLGAKAAKIENGEIVIRQGKYTLTARRLDTPGFPLRAPVCGSMSRTIYEHPSCKAYYRFEESGRTLLEMDAANAAFEYEY